MIYFFRHSIKHRKEPIYTALFRKASGTDRPQKIQKGKGTICT